jgi:hypothetical protein
MVGLFEIYPHLREILGYTLTGDSPGITTSSPNEKQLWLTLTKMHWLLDSKSHLSLSNKILLYKTILKPIWTYGIQLWGTASTSNVEILERFQ